MSGFTEQTNTPGGGFAAASPAAEALGAASQYGADSASSGREKTSVVIPMRITGAGILSGEHGAFEMGWNLCLQFIRWDNPNVDFKEWVYKNEQGG